MPKRLLRLSPTLLAVLAFAVAGVVMLAVALAAAKVIERRSDKVITANLVAAGMDWVAVNADGLQVHLSGMAPNEASRFRALNLVGALVDASRLRDSLDIAPTTALTAPRFSVEMLRNDDGIQLIGLMPEDPGEGGINEVALTEAAAALSPDIQVADMLEAAAWPAPENWNTALAFGIESLKMLKRSKISVSEDRVHITAIADSDAEKRRFESDLTGMKPEAVLLTMDISAPRPVLTPFTLRFIKDADGTRFDACSVDTERSRARILTAAETAGLQDNAVCTIGLGVPTPRWGDAVAIGIEAVAALGSGSITFSDADVTFLAGEDVAPADFDRVVGELRAALPDVFSLDAQLPKKESQAAGPAEFTAKLMPEGRVELRGRLTDESQQAAVDAFARAAFGAGQVYTATLLDPELPDGWPVRVLAGLEALSELHDGSLLVRSDRVEVKGVTGSQGARARITQVLSAKLGQGQTFKVDVRYDEELDPLAALPTPQECATEIAAAVAKRKITFTPGSAEIASEAKPTIDALAAILNDCPGLKMEIAGYTDSQGSEGGNQALSQARAEAVLVALQGRRIDVSGMSAKGYGEAFPIDDNDTEAGREANRRIEFVLLGAPAAVAPASDGTEGGGAAAQPAAAGPSGAPDFSGDMSPSVAPTEKTIRPQPRPEKNG